MAGAVTRFEDFQLFPLQKRYGPASGRLQNEPGFVAEHDSGLWVRDLIANATFTSPPGRNWDYGFIIRNPGANRLEIIGVTGAATWFHQSRDVGDDEYTDVANGFLWASGATLSSLNYLILFALEEVGLFFVNGQFVARLDLSHNLEYGGVSVMGDFFNNHRGEPSFSDFSIWTP